MALFAPCRCHVIIVATILARSTVFSSRLRLRHLCRDLDLPYTVFTNPPTPPPPLFPPPVTIPSSLPTQLPPGTLVGMSTSWWVVSLLDSTQVCSCLRSSTRLGPPMLLQSRSLLPFPEVFVREHVVLCTIPPVFVVIRIDHTLTRPCGCC